MRVKVCGITSLEDARLCEEAGADAVGFVHFPGRSRSLPLGRIREICGELGPYLVKVLVCAPRDKGEAGRMLRESGADALQCYSLGPEELHDLKRETRVIRAVSPDREEALRYAGSVDALLFESGVPGTGSGYDRSLVPLDCCERGIIAGGLTSSNLQEVISLGPYGVDVSSGVESSPGRKDPGKVREFIGRCR